MNEPFQTLDRDQVKAISPFLGRLDVHKIEITSGHSRVYLEIRPEHTNRNRTVHGGVVASILDVAVGTAATSVVDAEEFPITASLNVDFILPASAGESLVAEGKVVRKGSRIVFVEAAVLKGTGETIARGSAVMAIRPRGSHNSHSVG